MKKIIIILAALCSFFNLAIAQSQLQTYSVYDVNHNNEVKVDDAVAVANRAIGNTKEESQVVDAAAINSVLKTIKGKLEAIETRISVIEEKLGVETPAPTNSYTIYVGHTPENRLTNFTTEGLDEITFSDSDLPKVINRNLGVLDENNSQNTDKEYLVFPKGLNVTAQYDFVGTKIDVFNKIKRTDLKEGYNVWACSSFETNKPYIITISK